MVRRTRFTPPARPTAVCLLVVLALLTLCQSGCVRRRMTIRSNPLGASVFVDDQEIGTTPVSTDFTYYGTRKVQLIKDGYETLTVKQTFFAPWYEWPPLDFFSETLWPGEIRDEQFLTFQLQPQQILPPDTLQARAEELRMGARQDYLISLPNATATPQPVAPLPSQPLPLLPPPGT